MSTSTVSIQVAGQSRTYPVRRTELGRVEVMRPVDGAWTWLPLAPAMAARVQWDAA